ncbi:MAG: RHS repeat-associated core domain-containing protein, partial [Blastocatellia bacterium]
RVVSVDGGTTAQYKYDHQNRRVTKIVGVAWTHYLWQGSQVIGEHDATTAYTTNPTYQVNSALVDYIYAGSRMISSRDRASGGAPWTTKYYLSDRLSTRLVLNSGGNVLGRQAHLPFGEDFAESGTQEKHHFTQYERDGEIVTDYAVNRQYSSNLGRFMRTDPVGPVIDWPQSLNRYSYAGNDPVNASDPDGRVTDCRIVGTGTIWLSLGADGWARIGSFTLSLCRDIGPLRNDTGVGSGGGGEQKWTEEQCKKGLNDLYTLSGKAEAFAHSVFSEFDAGDALLTEFRNAKDRAIAPPDFRYRKDPEGVRREFSEIGKRAAALAREGGGDYQSALFSARVGRSFLKAFNEKLAEMTAGGCSDTLKSFDKALFDSFVSDIGPQENLFYGAFLEAVIAGLNQN